MILLMRSLTRLNRNYHMTGCYSGHFFFPKEYFLMENIPTVVTLCPFYSNILIMPIRIQIIPQNIMWIPSNFITKHFNSAQQFCLPGWKLGVDYNMIHNFMEQLLWVDCCHSHPPLLPWLHLLTFYFLNFSVGRNSQTTLQRVGFLKLQCKKLRC